MMTVKQVAALTGVSVRTLQFYDEIGLLKPTQSTRAGYRLYDGQALETLQQILFFKELDFTLREIKTILADPQFDKTAAYNQQRQLIRLKRDRLDGLLGLLDKLIQGEDCMEFKEFDMSEYFRVLAEFRETHADAIVQQMGSIEYFDNLLETMKAHEEEIAANAVKQYGTLENYTKALKANFGRFLAEGPPFTQAEAKDLTARTDAITGRLLADLTLDPASPAVQAVTRELVEFTDACNKSIDMGENYWAYMAETYLTSSLYEKVLDKKYGEGAAHFMGRALKAYLAGR